MKIMLQATEEQAEKLQHLALLGPDDQENWVSEIPTAFVQALAGMSKERVAAVATEWQAALEWEAPPTPILEQLVEVATEAVAAKKRMFSFVCL